MKKDLQKFILLSAFVLFTLSGALTAQVPNWQWAIGEGNNGTDEIASGITADAGGNVYTTGSYGGSTLAIGTATLTKSGFGANIFVTKQDPLGNIIWAKSFGGDGPGGGGGNGYAITTDASGNVYVAGYYIINLIIGTNTLTAIDSTSGSLGDIFITKLSSSGNVLWAKSAGGPIADLAYGVAVDGTGNVFITGISRSHNLKFGAITVVNSNNPAGGGFGDVFVAKYDASGNPLWARGAGTSGLDDGKGITVDASGNAIITGGFGSPSITFGTTTLTASSALNLFVTKYDTNGNVSWAKTATGAGSGSINHIATSVSADAANNTYITGSFGASTLTIGSFAMTNVSGNTFVAKLDATGNCIWAKNFAVGNANSTGIVSDANGNTYVGGYFTGQNIVVGTTTLTNVNTGGNNEDIFVTKLDGSGSITWAKSAGANFQEIAYGIGVDGSGNAVVCGKFTTTMVAFGTNTITGWGSSYADLFMAKLGNGVGIHEFGSMSSDIRIYPNPGTGIFYYKHDSKQVTEVLVTNALGEVILNNKTGPGINTIDLNDKAKGIYFVKLLDEGEMIGTGKLIVE